MFAIGMIALGIASDFTVRATYEQVYPLWAPDLSESSRQRHRYDLNRWESLTGDPLIYSISTATFSQFRVASAQRGDSANTTETTIRTIKQTLRAAVVYGLLDVMPEVGRPRRIAHPEPDPPTIDELDRMIFVSRRAGWPGPDWWPAWMLTSLWTGLRLSDVTWRLGMEHVNFDARVIDYRATKTGRRHRFPLPDVLIHHWRPLDRSASLFAISENASRLRAELDRIAVKAGVERRVTPKSFRQAAVTMWASVNPDCGKIIHGVGLPRMMSHYMDDLRILQANAHLFPWPEQAMRRSTRQLTLF